MEIRVLVVDDDPYVAHLHEQTVRSLPRFHVVGIARSGKQALALAKDLKPDLVILDIYMPEVDGIETLKQLRALRYPTDAILITAATEAKKLQEAVRYGALDFIIKPFKLQRLIEALQNYAARFDLLHSNEYLSQSDIDKTMRQDELTASADLLILPKGLNELTLGMISGWLKKQKGPLTAEDMAACSGVSRITARRYLEHLIATNQARVELSYGAGRPSRMYFSLS
ncbi:MAG: response regulator [Peptococcaceae bacterium]|nr:response regulator [Peptococcaceae bacterium]